MDNTGIHQVTLPLPFKLNHIHSYLVKGGNGWTIIDAGLHTEQSIHAWKQAFVSYKIDPVKDIEKIILTHYHPDHFGFAGVLQEWTGVNVHMSEVGRERALSTWTEQRYKENRKFYRTNGLPEELNLELAKNDQAFYPLVRPLPRKIEVIKEGAISIGDSVYEAILTPGHAEGHLCFYHRDKQVLIAGDLLLRKITPNISYHGYGDANPLASFFQSLEKMKQYEIQMAYPGHGPIFHDVQKRIEELLKHHQERLTQVFELIEGEYTAFQICKKLFNRELSTHEIRFAMGETIAHLRYLEVEGQIRQEVDSSGTIYYTR